MEDMGTNRESVEHTLNHHVEVFQGEVNIAELWASMSAIDCDMRVDLQNHRFVLRDFNIDHDRPFF